MKIAQSDFQKDVIRQYNVCFIVYVDMTETTTIHGIVIPAVWNEKGEVISAAIATYSEGKYLVEDSIKGRELLSFLRKRVVVHGVLAKRDQVNVIDVENFQEDASKA